ncbi:DUF2164 domain-containing protein [Paenibacillus campi]|uniref:DUF2164 domain-containing protein n=1 Tax=Paenibacillus campi TaxID=3106031 RepID=UPI002AFE9B4D|nr:MULTISPECIES: DUF2164 domain-containing protein [unclassified Paenibacillus]
MQPLKLPRETRETMIANIQQFFEMERGETIGELAADHVLDFAIKTIGPHLYNQALADCRALVNERMAAMEEDMYALEQRTTLRPR